MCILLNGAATGLAWVLWGLDVIRDRIESEFSVVTLDVWTRIDPFLLNTTGYRGLNRAFEAVELGG